MPMERVLVARLVWAAMVVAELRGLSGCMLKERLGLMALWNAMPSDQLTALPSKNDCCLWDGVNCSATTGRVQSLDLYSFHRPSTIFGRDSHYYLNISLLLPFEELSKLVSRHRFRGLINQQDLTKLTRLETLTMKLNNLTNNVSLQAFASMKNLKYLDLSHNNMDVSTKGICEMKKIIKLDLSFNAIGGHLPPCIGNLTQLQILDISDNQISGNIPSTIGNLSHLSSLSLTKNYFSGSFSLHFLANNSKLENLYLSSNDNRFQVETETQSWFPSFQLKSFSLRNSNLNKISNSVIPAFLLHQSELMAIDLNDNNLRDTFPSWLLQNNSKLEWFSMANNSLAGNLVFPDFIRGLLYIDVSGNKIGGKLPNNLQVILPSLQILIMSKNRFEGNLPSSFGALTDVDLSFNSFSGALPETLLANNLFLSYVDLSNNLLRGKISLNFTTLPSLNYLYLSSNKFSGIFEELPSQSSPQLQGFDVSDNLISAKLSNLIADFPSLEVLKVSNNFLEDGIPDKLCHLRKLDHLDVSNNNLSGSIPSCLKTLSVQFLYMRNCSLSGGIPDELSMNSMLIDIDLSYNHFSPSILPSWIYSQQGLRILVMAGVQLEGEISTRFCGLKNIKIIDLSHNNLKGSIPSCLFQTRSWVVETPDDYVIWWRDSKHSSFTSRPSTVFGVDFTTKGASFRYQGRILNLMKGMDLSCNKLSGQIPPQIGKSKAIRALNLSNNRLWGSIPSSISMLEEIESLDLSSNNLSGEIPSEIIRLNFLSTFNVSNNNLSGRIPNGGQFSNFDERNYGGNELLCGPRLHRLCTRSSSPSARPPDEEDDDETMFETWSFWWSFVAAYVAVVISVVVVVGTDTRCSRVWFRAVDAVSSKTFCVFAKLNFILGLK